MLNSRKECRGAAVNDDSPYREPRRQGGKPCLVRDVPGLATQGSAGRTGPSSLAGHAGGGSRRAQLGPFGGGVGAAGAGPYGLIDWRPDPSDRRARRIVATPRGLALLDQLGEQLRAAEDQVLAGLESDGDRQAFRALLRRLAVHAATALDSAPDACAAARPRPRLSAAASPAPRDDRLRSEVLPIPCPGQCTSAYRTA